MESNSRFYQLVDERKFLATFSEESLGTIGFKDNEVKKLREDNFQWHAKRRNGFLGALVLNHLSRNKVFSNGSVTDRYVPAFLFAEAIDMKLEDLLLVSDGTRQLIVERGEDDSSDIYVSIPDLHFFTERGNNYNSLTELANRYSQTRNSKLRDVLATKAQEVVKKLAERLYRKIQGRLSVEELASYGNVGLLEAIGGYDSDRGVKFETFAGPRIHGSMMDVIRDMDLTPRLIRTRQKIIEEFRKKYVEENNQNPTSEDYKSEWLRRGYPESSFDEFYLNHQFSGPNISLDNETTKGTETSKKHGQHDSIPDRKIRTPLQEMISIEMMDQFRLDMEAIPPQYRPGIEAYILEDKTMKEAGQVIDVSESRFSQICSHYVRSPDFFRRTREYMNQTTVINLKLHV